LGGLSDMQKRRNWQGVTIVALTVLVVLAGASVIYASGAGGHGGSKSFISPEKLKDLLWRVLNFTGLVIILVMALKKPLTNALHDRRHSIVRQFEELDIQKAEAEKKYKEYEAKIATLDAEVKSIIEAALAQGESEKKRIIEEANRAAGDIKRKAEMAVQYEVALATRRLRAEVADQAVQMAEEIISRNLLESDQIRLVENYLEKVGGLKQ